LSVFAKRFIAIHNLNLNFNSLTMDSTSLLREHLSPAVRVILGNMPSSLDAWKGDPGTSVLEGWEKYAAERKACFSDVKADVATALRWIFFEQTGKVASVSTDAIGRFDVSWGIFDDEGVLKRYRNTVTRQKMNCVKPREQPTSPVKSMLLFFGTVFPAFNTEVEELFKERLISLASWANCEKQASCFFGAEKRG
jgi:hypothetical protein